MKLIRVHIISAQTCGGLLDGLDIWFRNPNIPNEAYEPQCLIGPNGAGKSQFLQIVGEIFQAILHAATPNEERTDGNPQLQFEIEYLITPPTSSTAVHVRATRKSEIGHRTTVKISTKVDDEWTMCDLNSAEIIGLLPTKIIGYTSGNNETLSLPFLLSRSSYADDVGSRALKTPGISEPIPDTRLMLIDYGTHLEVLVANLLLGSNEQHIALLQEAGLSSLQSFRCIIQLAHSAAPKISMRQPTSSRKGIQLTNELESYIDRLCRCATCYDHDPKTDTYIFDFLVDQQTVVAFQHYWSSVLDLYSAFHKLSMLNDLAIPRDTRKRFKKDTHTRRFASRLPEPQDEDKVFRFEQVSFHSHNNLKIVDYVSLSDGEHQLAQLLGVFCMISFPNVLFLLDEPESHFNPQWRVKFISRLLNFPTDVGLRADSSSVTSCQDCLLTTHAPFVVSDTPRDRVFIFKKNNETGKVLVKRPGIETYGTTFDAILEECFDISPPISQISRDDIQELMNSKDPDHIRDGIRRLGESVEKVFLADHLRQLPK